MTKTDCTFTALSVFSLRYLTWPFSCHFTTPWTLNVCHAERALYDLARTYDSRWDSLHFSFFLFFAFVAFYVASQPMSRAVVSGWGNGVGKKKQLAAKRTTYGTSRLRSRGERRRGNGISIASFDFTTAPTTSIATSTSWTTRDCGSDDAVPRVPGSKCNFVFDS